MKKYTFLIFFTAAIIVRLDAQIIIEQEVVTDTVSLFSVRESSETYSGPLALSILLPGLGHQYIQRPGHALAYMTTDILSLFGAVFFYSQSRNFTHSAMAHAWIYAGASGSLDNELYWRHVGNFQSAQDYNTRVKQVLRNEEEKYTDPDVWWEWSDQIYQDEYNRIRERARYFQVASSFFVGALVLNRVVSFIDARTFLRKRSSTLLSSIEVKPYLCPDFSVYGLSLHTQF